MVARWNIWIITSTCFALASCGNSHKPVVQKQQDSANTLVNYKWTQVLPYGNGTFPYEWKEGTFPLGLRPLEAFGGNLWMVTQKWAWSSPDGVKWTRHDKKDWGERIYTEYVVFKDKMWMFAGLSYQDNVFMNDIWSSANGVDWKQEVQHAPWQSRGGISAVVFKDKLWLMGGSVGLMKDRTPNKFMNDIWSSEDGINWKQETVSAPWTAREYPSVLVFHDTLYLLGGQGNDDTWRSADGRQWEQLITHAPWKQRFDNGVIVYDNKIWVFGGRDTSSNHTLAALNDVWSTPDGKTWKLESAHAPWTVRSAACSVVFKDKLWIYSGKHTGGKYNWGGDVWTMEKEKPQRNK